LVERERERDWREREIGREREREIGERDWRERLVERLERLVERL